MTGTSFNIVLDSFNLDYIDSAVVDVWGLPEASGLDGWSEGSITFSNAPAVGTATTTAGFVSPAVSLGSFTVTKATDVAGTVYTVSSSALQSLAEDSIAGDGDITIMLSVSGDFAHPDNAINFASQTHATLDGPSIEVQTTGSLTVLDDDFDWSSVSGRIYSVYGTTNLLDGFELLDSNIPWSQTSFTNSNYGTWESGFYKIKVELE